VPATQFHTCGYCARTHTAVVYRLFVVQFVLRLGCCVVRVYGCRSLRLHTGCHLRFWFTRSTTRLPCAFYRSSPCRWLRLRLRLRLHACVTTRTLHIRFTHYGCYAAVTGYCPVPHCRTVLPVVLRTCHVLPAVHAHSYWVRYYTCGYTFYHYTRVTALRWVTVTLVTVCHTTRFTRYVYARVGWILPFGLRCGLHVCGLLRTRGWLRYTTFTRTVTLRFAVALPRWFTHVGWLVYTFTFTRLRLFTGLPRCCRYVTYVWFYCGYHALPPRYVTVTHYGLHTVARFFRFVTFCHVYTAFTRYATLHWLPRVTVCFATVTVTRARCYGYTFDFTTPHVCGYVRYHAHVTPHYTVTHTVTRTFAVRLPPRTARYRFGLRLHVTRLRLPFCTVAFACGCTLVCFTLPPGSYHCARLPHCRLHVTAVRTGSRLRLRVLLRLFVTTVARFYVTVTLLVTLVYVTVTVAGSCTAVTTHVYVRTRVAVYTPCSPVTYYVYSPLGYYALVYLPAYARYGCYAPTHRTCARSRFCLVHAHYGYGCGLVYTAFTTRLLRYVYGWLHVLRFAPHTRWVTGLRCSSLFAFCYAVTHAPVCAYRLRTVPRLFAVALTRAAVTLLHAFCHGCGWFTTLPAHTHAHYTLPLRSLRLLVTVAVTLPAFAPGFWLRSGLFTRFTPPACGYTHFGYCVPLPVAVVLRAGYHGWFYGSVPTLPAAHVYWFTLRLLPCGSFLRTALPTRIRFARHTAHAACGCVHLYHLPTLYTLPRYTTLPTRFCLRLLHCSCYGSRLRSWFTRSFTTCALPPHGHAPGSTCTHCLRGCCWFFFIRRARCYFGWFTRAALRTRTFLRLLVPPPAFARLVAILFWLLRTAATPFVTTPARADVTARAALVAAADARVWFAVAVAHAHHTTFTVCGLRGSAGCGRAFLPLPRLRTAVYRTHLCGLGCATPLHPFYRFALVRGWFCRCRAALVGCALLPLRAPHALRTLPPFYCPRFALPPLMRCSGLLHAPRTGCRAPFAVCRRVLPHARCTALRVAFTTRFCAPFARVTRVTGSFARSVWILVTATHVLRDLPRSAVLVTVRFATHAFTFVRLHTAGCGYAFCGYCTFTAVRLRLGLGCTVTVYHTPLRSVPVGSHTQFYTPTRFPLHTLRYCARTVRTPLHTAFRLRTLRTCVLFGYPLRTTAHHTHTHHTRFCHRTTAPHGLRGSGLRSRALPHTTVCRSLPHHRCGSQLGYVTVTRLHTGLPLLDCTRVLPRLVAVLHTRHCRVTTTFGCAAVGLRTFLPTCLPLCRTFTALVGCRTVRGWLRGYRVCGSVPTFAFVAAHTVLLYLRFWFTGYTTRLPFTVTRGLLRTVTVLVTCRYRFTVARYTHGCVTTHWLPVAFRRFGCIPVGLHRYTGRTLPHGLVYRFRLVAHFTVACCTVRLHTACRFTVWLRFCAFFSHLVRLHTGSRYARYALLHTTLVYACVACRSGSVRAHAYYGCFCTRTTLHCTRLPHCTVGYLRSATLVAVTTGCLLPRPPPFTPAQFAPRFSPRTRRTPLLVYRTRIYGLPARFPATTTVSYGSTPPPALLLYPFGCRLVTCGYCYTTRLVCTAFVTRGWLYCVRAHAVRCITPFTHYIYLHGWFTCTYPQFYSSCSPHRGAFAYTRHRLHTAPVPLAPHHHTCGSALILLHVTPLFCVTCRFPRSPVWFYAFTTVLRLRSPHGSLRFCVHSVVYLRGCAFGSTHLRGCRLRFTRRA